MNRLKISGVKGLSPLTPAVLDLRIGIFTSVFKGLLKSSKSSWILALELRLKQKVQHFCGVQDHSLSPAVLLPLTGVSGSDQRLRLVTPSLCHRHHQSTQPKNRVAMHPARNVIATLTTPQPKEKRYG